MIGKSIKISGTGIYLPTKKSSEQIELENGIPCGWSMKFSGVRNRHQVTHESNAFMGARAAEQALQKANITIGAIDVLISAGGTYDYPLPNQASMIKHELIKKEPYDFPAIDIDSTCISFITALEIASLMIDGITYKRILIVSSEIASKGLNPKNWETYTLFGDGAAAAIIEYDFSGESSVLKSLHRTYSEGVYQTIIEGGGNANYFRENPYDPELHSFKMEGKKLLRLAKRKIPFFVTTFFQDLDGSIEDVDLIIPHQASRAGLETFKKMYDFHNFQVLDTLCENGNCIAASIPITLHCAIEQKRLQKGQTCLLIGTAAGFSIGALLFRY